MLPVHLLFCSLRQIEKQRARALITRSLPISRMRINSTKWACLPVSVADDESTLPTALRYVNIVWASGNVFIGLSSSSGGLPERVETEVEREGWWRRWPSRGCR
jgi:hypothetical protein